MRLLSVLCGILLLTFLLGCGSTERLAEREIIEAAPRYIGPADRYDADVEGLGASHARQVRLTGYGVRPEPNIILQTLTLTVTDVDYQRSPFRITRIGNADFTVQVTDAAMTQYLAARATQRAGQVTMRNVRVTFLQNQVQVTGIATVGGQDLPVTTTGTLQPQNALVLYQPRTITIGDVALGEQLRTATAQWANPLVDLSRLTFEPQIQAVALTPGRITVTGTANANRLLDRQPRE